jgi:nicotinamidase/pyrazinamidase
MMKALVVVDVQNDFLKAGALEVQKGDEIIPLINALAHYPFDIIVATKDWHPADHLSFANNHHKNPGEHVMLGGVDQILWPAHCIQGSKGAEFGSGWDTTCLDKIIYKGTNPSIDSYSTFYDNGHRLTTGLENYLREKGVNEIYFAGLATDYCVKYSVLDAIQLGFTAYVIIDACRGVNLKENDSKEALQQMQLAGATLIHSSGVAELLAKKKDNNSAF